MRGGEESKFRTDDCEVVMMIADDFDDQDVIVMFLDCDYDKVCCVLVV